MLDNFASYEVKKYENDTAKNRILLNVMKIGVVII